MVSMRPVYLANSPAASLSSAARRPPTSLAPHTRRRPTAHVMRLLSRAALAARARARGRARPQRHRHRRRAQLHLGDRQRGRARSRPPRHARAHARAARRRDALRGRLQQLLRAPTATASRAAIALARLHTGRRAACRPHSCSAGGPIPVTDKSAKGERQAEAPRVGGWRASACRRLIAPRNASKKQKKTAELMPLLSARGPTPLRAASPPDLGRCSGPTPAHATRPQASVVFCQGGSGRTLVLGRAGGAAHRKNWAPEPSAAIERAAPSMVGRLAAEHIMLVLMTSSGVVAAAANAPATAPMAKSSCARGAVVSAAERPPPGPQSPCAKRPPHSRPPPATSADSCCCCATRHQPSAAAVRRGKAATTGVQLSLPLHRSRNANRTASPPHFSCTLFRDGHRKTASCIVLIGCPPARWQGARG
jgi:hypothetical protein